MFHALCGATICLALFVNPSILVAQQGANGAKTPGAPEIAKMAKEFLSADYVLDGSVVDEAGDSDSGGGGAIIMGAGGAANFHGKFEVVHSAAGELAAVTKGAMPRVAFIDDGVRRISCVLSEGDEVGAARFSNELSAILAPDEFAKVAGKVEWTATPGEKGEVTYRASFPIRFLRAVAGGDGMRDIMAPKVIGVGVSLKFGADGQISGLTVGVERSDPTSNLRKRALSGELSGGTVSPSEIEDDGESGQVTTYTLTKKSGKPSKRTLTTLEFLRESTKSEKD